MYLPWPFSSARKVRHGVPLLIVLIVSLAVLYFLFFPYVPWLTSEPMDKLSMCDKPDPVPPAWARSFAVNHGTFWYYRESPADRPGKALAIVSSMGVLSLVAVICCLYLMRGEKWWRELWFRRWW